MPEKKLYSVQCAFDCPAYFRVEIEAATPEEAIEIAKAQCADGSIDANDWSYEPELGDSYRVVDEAGDVEEVEIVEMPNGATAHLRGGKGGAP